MTENEEAGHTAGTTYAEAGLEPPAATRPIYRSQDGPPQLLAVVECPECERLRRTLDDHLLSEAAETRRADRAEAALREQPEEWRERALLRLLRARAEKAEAERDRLKEHWRCREHGEFGSHQWGCPDCVASMRRTISSLSARAEDAERMIDEAWRYAERCRDDRAAVLMVETTDGLPASEWLMRTALAERARDSERLRAEKAEGVQWKHDPGNILRASAARLQRLDPYGPTIDFDIFDYDHDEYCPQDSRERGGDPRPSVVVYLPHSCNEWVIGGAEHVKALIADLQQALIDLEAWRP